MLAGSLAVVAVYCALFSGAAFSFAVAGCAFGDGCYACGVVWGSGDVVDDGYLVWVVFWVVECSEYWGYFEEAGGGVDCGLGSLVGDC